MIACLAWLPVVLGVLACGLVVLRAMRADAGGPPGLRLGLVVAAGLAVTLLALYVPVAVTGAVAFAPALVLHVGCTAACLPWLRGRLRAARGRAAGPLLVLAALAAVLFVDTATRRPFTNYDAKAIYALKAKALLHEGTLETPLFRDPDVVHYHADYPLGVPLLMAYTGWIAQGGEGAPRADDAALHPAAWAERHGAVERYMGVTVLWVLALAGLVGASIVQVARRGWQRALLFVCAVPLAWVAPWDLGASWRATAETPLAVCVGVVALGLARRLRAAGSTSGPRDPAARDGGEARRQRAFTAALLLAALAAPLLKSDALLGLGALGLAFLRSARGAARVRGLAWLAAGALPAALVVHAGRRFIVGAPYDEHYLRTLLDADVGLWLSRLPSLPGAVLESLLHTHLLPYWIFTLAVAVPLAWRAEPGLRLLARALVLHVLACSAIFVVTPNVQSWHVYYALPRLWSQMGVPAGVLVVAALVRLARPGVAAAARVAERPAARPAGRPAAS